MLKTETICISPEGTAFRERIISLLTKTVLSEKEHPKMLAYLDSGIEQRKFEGADTQGVLRKMNIMTPGCYFKVSELDGHRIFEFTPQQTPERTVMYIHGGAYVFGYTDIYFRFNEELAEKCRAKVSAPIYGLAGGEKKGVYREAYGFLVSAYLALMEEGRPVYIMGDSSGGAMAVRLCQILKEKGIPEPAGLILFSPFVDATLKDPIDKDLEDRDITLDRFGLTEFAQMWAGDTDLSGPDISPLNGPMEGLPKTMVVVGTDEIFLPSNESLAEKIDSAGGDATLVKCTGLYHIFPVYTELPESRKVMDLVRGFCVKE